MDQAFSKEIDATKQIEIDEVKANTARTSKGQKAILRNPAAAVPEGTVANKIFTAGEEVGEAVIMAVKRYKLMR